MKAQKFRFRLDVSAILALVAMPHSAFAMAGRADLAESLRKKGEIRVVVGLETPQEIAPRTAITP